MTITKKAWDNILSHYEKRIKHSHEVGDDVKYLDGIHMVADDILAKLRNTPIVVFAEKETGTLRRETCNHFLFKVFNDALSTLNDCHDVNTFVVCLDRYGARRMEKMATFLKRKRPVVHGAPEFLTVPPGQVRFFESGKQMPSASMDLIFSTHLSKLDFYCYITEFVQSEEFRSHIPEGKHFILSGATSCNEARDEVVHMSPVKVSRNNVELLFTFRCDHISEGDVDVWRWPLYFCDSNCCIKSYDGDVFLIGLMHIRHLLLNNPERRILFVTRRSVGSAEITDSVLKHKNSMKIRKCLTYETVLDMTGGDIQEAHRQSGGVVPTDAIYEKLLVPQYQGEARLFEISIPQARVSDVQEPSTSIQEASLLGERSSVPVANLIDVVCPVPLLDDASAASCSSTSVDIDNMMSTYTPRNAKRKAPVWGLQYIDMVGIHNDIIETEYNRMEEEGTFMANPIESSVLALFLSSDSHDYVDTKRFTKGLGSEHVWKAFQNDPQKFRDLVVVGDLSPDPIIKCLTYSYAINVKLMRELCIDAYTAKFRSSMNLSKVNKTPEKLRDAQDQKGYDTCMNNVSDDALNVVAAQCVWTLQYWGNGVFHNYEIQDGLALDINGNSLYGYTNQGWASKVSNSAFKISPPIQCDHESQT